MPTRGAPNIRVEAVVGVVVALGAVALSVAAWVTAVLPTPAGSPGLHSGWLVAAFIVAAAAAEIVRVPLQHGEGREELTFFEIVTVAGIMVLTPTWAIFAPIIGLGASQLALRKAPIKAAFNLGSYATATALAVAVYLDLSGGASRFSPRAIGSLLVAMALFSLVNTLFLAFILHAAQGIPRLTVLRDVWGLSFLMTVGSIGVGAVAVAVTVVSPTLLPFTTLPAVALWYAYHLAAAHAAERERNRWLVVLAGVLADTHSAPDLLTAAVDAIRASVGATSTLVLRPGEAGIEALGDLVSDTPVAVPADRLPPGWGTAVGTRLDLGTDVSGVLLLGSPVGAESAWKLRPADSPMLAALVASLGSALRGADHLTALVEETSKLTAVVAHASDGIVVIADGGSVQLWSPAMTRICGVSEQSARQSYESVPQVLRMLTEVPGPAADGHVGSDGSEPRRDLPSRETLTMELTRPDGEVRDVVVSVSHVRPLHDSGRVAILTVHDVTAERRADRLKADFVATISHELRTPITPIKGYAQLLSLRGEEMGPDRRQAALKIIADRATHLERLVDDLLMASHVSGLVGGELTILATDHDLRTLVTQAMESFPDLAGRIRLDAANVELPVYCDQVRTVQILSNLLSNAGKYSPDDTAITVTLCAGSTDDPYTRVQVTDLGMGIASSDQEKVFERFYRVEDSLTMSTSGSGLGLYIARALARAMGGDLCVASSPGAGATFTLTLPIAESPAAEGGSSLARAAFMESQPSRVRQPVPTSTESQ